VVFCRLPWSKEKVGIIKTIFELSKTLTDAFDIIIYIPIGPFDNDVLPRAFYIEARKLHKLQVSNFS
jgi:hypothetical protein